MSRKIIDKTKLAWQDDQQFRLSYQMVFDEKKDENESVNVSEALKAERQKWAAETEAARKEAFGQGYKLGREEGYSDAGAEMDQRIASLRQAYMEAIQAWEAQQKLLKPGLLNLVFDIAEKILGIPVTNGAMRNKLEEELSILFQQIEKESRPVLWVSAEDFDFVESLQEKYAEKTGVVLRIGKQCNPGEFQLETNQEKVVRDFRQMLHDFKESLILPQ
ncbi:FliH/SctL family protein [Balneolaceae bacterium ANBcel3]|nr:FliH/SctL family protein [Balneolaceae bacterium ANBcel3]